MAKPMIRIHDLATNEVIDREMNAEEYAQYQADLAADKAEQAAAEAKAAAKSAIVDRLGLTADELQVLLG
jgi:hypothetical protein